MAIKDISFVGVLLIYAGQGFNFSVTYGYGLISTDRCSAGGIRKR